MPNIKINACEACDECLCPACANKLCQEAQCAKCLAARQAYGLTDAPIVCQGFTKEVKANANNYRSS